MEEKRHIREEDILSRGIKKEQTLHTGPEEKLSLQRQSAIKATTESKKVEPVSKGGHFETNQAISQNVEADKRLKEEKRKQAEANTKSSVKKSAIQKAAEGNKESGSSGTDNNLSSENKKSILGNRTNARNRNAKDSDGKTYHGVNKKSTIKKIGDKNKKGVRTKNHKHSAKLRMKDAIKYKRINELMNSDDPTATVELMTKQGIQKFIAFIMLVVRKILAAAGHLALTLFSMLAPVLIFLAPILLIVICVAGFAGQARNNDRQLTFGITGDLNYVSYLQGTYQRQYGETGWCGITSYTDILASYGCTSPYRSGELINPCDAVRYADESGTAIIGEEDGVHYLNENWYSTLCAEYGLEFEAVRSDRDVYGQVLLDWVNEKLDEGWQVVVCFDDYSRYESGAYITTNRHYIWLVCYADSNHDTYACIDPGNGCADSTFLSEATVEGGYRDLIVNKSQILDYTGGTNFITGFAVRMPESDENNESNE